jgi:hypothetical protein
MPAERPWLGMKRPSDTDDREVILTHVFRRVQSRIPIPASVASVSTGDWSGEDTPDRVPGCFPYPSKLLHSLAATRHYFSPRPFILLKNETFASLACVRAALSIEVSESRNQET